MKKTILFLAAGFVLYGCGGNDPSSQTDTQASATELTDGQANTHIRDALHGLGNITDVRPSEWPGVYEVVINGQLLYASADGSHFIAGDMYRTKGQVNLTDLQRDDLRKQVLADLAPEDTIVFSPSEKPQHIVYVFTDIDCPYCQRFHADIDQYTALGIEVRYLAFPRAGQGSPSWALTQSVWCADSPKAALTQAKQGAQVDATQDCTGAPVAHGYAAGKAIGLRGTPMILDAAGRNLGGYLPPEDLQQRLQQASSS